MRGPACNLPAAEREEALGLFTFPTLGEMNRAKRAFRKYIFYDTWGRRNFREVFCPACGRYDIEKEAAYDVYTDNFFEYHHGDQTNCPMCGQPGWLICLGKMRTYSSLTETRKMMILRAADDALLVMAGTFTVEYAHNDLDPYPMWYGTKHYLFRRDKRMQWTKQERGRWEKGKWIPEGFFWRENKHVSEPFPDGYNMGGGYLDGSYTVIGAEEVAKTSMRYSQLLEYFCGEGADLYNLEGVTVRGIVPYLAEYTRRPQMEMLVKLDHTDVIEELLRGMPHADTIDWKAKTPPAFFRLSKPDYRKFRAAGGRLYALEAWRKTMPDADFWEFLRLQGIFGEHLGRFLELWGADPRREKVARWYASQKSHCAEVWDVWQDLLQLEAELGNDVTHDDVLMPEQLRERHDEAVAIRNELRAREARKSYGSRFRALKRRYGYSDGTLTVTVPTCAEEIENEGAALRHCVAGYAKRHIEGVVTILFLRWSDDLTTPYMTIEVAGNAIKQIHGYRNDIHHDQVDPEDAHGEFLQEWTKWLRQGSPRRKNGRPIRPIMNDKEVKTA